jgi:hypothetical protein
VKWKDTPLWFRIILAFAVTNFLSFFFISGFNGGDGLNGKIEDGKYFVSSHGRNTEVSKAFFEYSRVHAVSVLITHALAITSGIWVFYRRKATSSRPKEISNPSRRNF